MKYREFNPIPPLQGIVECLWTLKSDGVDSNAPPERVLPDGRSEIIINRAAPFVEIRDGEAPILQPAVIVAAQLTKHLLIQSTSEVDLIGIRFFPTAIGRLLREEVRQLVDLRIDLASINSRFCNALLDVAHIKDPTHVGLQSILANHFSAKSNHRDQSIERAVGVIRQRMGQCSIADIADSLALSPRQLERRFLSEVGVSPKTYARIARFDALIRHAQSTDRLDWTSLAHRFGFHDQPHLNREFRAFAGQTPTEFAKANNQLSFFFTSGPSMSDFYKPGQPVAN